MAESLAPREFKIPQEPLPVPPVGGDDKIAAVPSLFSDEESFVVLGPSLVDLSFEDEPENHDGKSLIQEARQVLREELDKLSLQHSSKPISESELSGDNATEQLKPDTNGQAVALNQSGVQFHTASFSGMDQSTLLPAIPQEINPRPDVDAKEISGTISIISFAPSEFASEELQNKVSQLIEENVHLKDVIMQNNLSMKAQRDRIEAWQNDVEKVYQAHKLKFLNAKQIIDTLKKENASLKLEIDNLQTSLSIQKLEHNKTKLILTESNPKELDMDTALWKIKDLEHALNELQIKTEMERKGDLEKLAGMEKKLGFYEEELENTYKKIRTLEKANEGGPAQEEVEDKFKELENKLQQSELALDSANNEILSLRNRLAKNLQLSDESSKINFHHQKKAHELEKKLVARNESLMEADLRLKKSEENLRAANEKIKGLEYGVMALKGQLEEAKIDVWQKNQKLTEKESQLVSMQTALETTRATSAPPMASNSEEITYLRHQLMQSQMTLTQCIQNRAVAYAQIEQQKNELLELQNSLQRKPSDDDTVFALQTQLEVYKNDFEAERNAKEEIKLEKNKLSEDLQHLHRRNQQLQEEVELLREQLPSSAATRGRAQHRREDPGAASGLSTATNPSANYSCPKCNFGFTTVNAIENHVNRCLFSDES